MNIKTFYAIFFTVLSLNASFSIIDINEETESHNYEIGRQISCEDLIQRTDKIISSQTNYEMPIETVILPKDIIVLISSLLTMHDHLKMTKVCKSWHQALNDLKNCHLQAIWKKFYECEFEFMMLSSLNNMFENSKYNRAEFKNFIDKYKRYFIGELYEKLEHNNFSFNSYKSVIKCEFVTTKQICTFYLNYKYVEKIKSTKTVTSFLSKLRQKIETSSLATMLRKCSF